MERDTTNFTGYQAILTCLIAQPDVLPEELITTQGKSVDEVLNQMLEETGSLLYTHRHQLLSHPNNWMGGKGSLGYKKDSVWKNEKFPTFA